MNFKMIGRLIAFILLVEAVVMVPPALISVFDGDMADFSAFLVSMGVTLICAGALYLPCRNAKKNFYSREGLVCVGLSWIALSFFGSLPFLLSNSIPRFIDALFEIVSGFTTTGASILTDVEALGRGMLYWRSFSHWLGGMGVLVFLLAIVPISGRNSGFSVHLLRAESPGPTVEKLVPRMRGTAEILYFMYIALTVLDIIFLLVGGLPLFDALCIAFGTAGTGGFSILNSGFADYSPYIQNVTTVFLMLFGVNFNCYYLLLMRQFRSIKKDEEIKLYFSFAVLATFLITCNTFKMYSSMAETARHAAFQVASIMTTAGFATTNFDLWPSFSKMILFMLMLIGACAGSTGGGFKFSRVLILAKSLRRRIRQILYPQNVQVVRLSGQTVNEHVVNKTAIYLVGYMFIIVLSSLVISLDNFSITTNLSAVVACFNNIGPGFEMVGAVGNYSAFSDFSKLVLIFDMLAGRLEIFPILVLFSRKTWRR